MKYFIRIKWDKVFKNGPSKGCGKQPLKNLKFKKIKKQKIKNSNFLKAVINKFYLVHSRILSLKFRLSETLKKSYWIWLFASFCKNIFELNFPRQGGNKRVTSNIYKVFKKTQTLKY